MMNLSTAIQKLKQKGYKHTKQREHMLNFLISQDRYIPVKDILYSIQQVLPNVSHNTIYRNLYLLANEKLLEMTNLHGKRYFRFACNLMEITNILFVTYVGVQKHLNFIR
ncbi:Fur family transcriptional regulator [Virgibacillus salexigens]|uniref:Fur family transcriptional regulator n=1 Tax=Virgibacillus salexigens TaxID=61016 RepID=UPI001F26C1B2|nr:transcriptional repressor [Virgibacillus salexigens]